MTQGTGFVYLYIPTPSMEGLGSGQTHQTVNLTPSASQVRILSPPPLSFKAQNKRNVRQLCGCSSMVEPQPSKLVVWVRFPSPAPISGCYIQPKLTSRPAGRFAYQTRVIASKGPVFPVLLHFCFCDARLYLCKIQIKFLQRALLQIVTKMQHISDITSIVKFKRIGCYRAYAVVYKVGSIGL